jgi:hypothetical protein
LRFFHFRFYVASQGALSFPVGLSMLG